MKAICKCAAAVVAVMGYTVLLMRYCNVRISRTARRVKSPTAWETSPNNGKGEMKSVRTV